METTSESEQQGVKSDIPDLRDPDRRQAVLDELERVLQGKHFRNSGRAKQFLQFVVEKTLEDHSDDLKERRIGAELFHRSLDYSTGDDPVVRVQAVWFVEDWNSTTRTTKAVLTSESKYH